MMTTLILKKIRKHFHPSKPQGSPWTLLHKPLAVIDITEGDRSVQRAVTLAYMQKYGIDNVRGYAWSAKVFLPGMREGVVKLLAQMEIDELFA